MTPEQVAETERTLVVARFLGQGVRCAPRLARVLAKVEEALHAEWQHASIALPGGAKTPAFAEWHGIRGVLGYRKPIATKAADGTVTYRAQGQHSYGLAIDLNYPRNGYLVCRTMVGGRAVFGGEAAGVHLAGARKAFADACDRACLAFDGAPADIAARKRDESTGAVWDRWHRVSTAVAKYFAPFYQVTDDYDAGEPDAIPGVMIPPQIAADYEAISTPLVVGAPTRQPGLTRNPAKGLIDIPRAVLVAFGEVGARIGLCDFGSSESGDAMHVDLAARIASGG